jgi:hypothetical protein
MKPRNVGAIDKSMKGETETALGELGERGIKVTSASKASKLQ